MKRIGIVLVLVQTLVATQAQVDLRKLDAYYSRALSDWQVPGMAVAIVKDGKVVFSKGYGLKEIGKSDAPDENTLFAIASNSKAFTTAAIALLVQEGKMGWDDKVRDYLPYFELYDPFVSEEATIRDLLSHRVGLRTFSGDLIWYRSTLSAEEIIRRVKYLPRAYDFRSGYGYSNVMFITAGEVIRKVTGKEWGRVIKERFFDPLGMTRSISTTKDLARMGNAATPHGLIDGKHRPIEWEDWQTVAATGGIISSVKDLAQWMIFNLNHGVWKGDTILTPASRNMLWTPHNNFMIDHTDQDNSAHFRGYALGWSVSDYYGKLRVGHTGGYTGMLSTIMLIPDENLGVVVLTNGMKPLFAPIANYTIDRFLNAPMKDWSAEMLQTMNARKDTRIEERMNARVLNTTPSVDPDKYLGEYHANSYGQITIKKTGNDLKISFEHTPDFTATLTHWHYDVWKMTWDNPDMMMWFPYATVQFRIDSNNNVTGLAFDIPNNDFWFEELESKKMK